MDSNVEVEIVVTEKSIKADEIKANQVQMDESSGNHTDFDPVSLNPKIFGNHGGFPSINTQYSTSRVVHDGAGSTCSSTLIRQDGDPDCSVPTSPGTRRGSTRHNSISSSSKGVDGVSISSIQSTNIIHPVSSQTTNPVVTTDTIRVRIHLYVIFTFYCICFFVLTSVSIYNCFQTTAHSISSIGAWSYEYEDARAQQVVLVMIPRMLFMMVTFISTAFYLMTLLHYKCEKFLVLSDFLHEDNYPSVDILLPRYKEPWLLYKPTIMACINLDYPSHKIAIYVCDDGGRLEEHSIYRKCVEELPSVAYPRLYYLKRANGNDAKAGNLNNALKYACGDLVVVLDADHQCKPNFLINTIPHMLEKLVNNEGPYGFKKIAFVQTRQCFFNKNDILVRLLNGSFHAFYGLLMPAFSGLGVAPCVGTGYIMQRNALREIGGYVRGCSVEDVITSIELHKRRWTSKYLDVEYVVGLSPCTLKEFFDQRIRWVYGNAQLLFYQKIWSKQLSFNQQLGILVANYYWLLLPVILLLNLLRTCLWVGFDIAHGTTAAAAPFATEYATIILLLSFPKVSFLDKICDIMGFFAFTPVYLLTTWKLIRGHLNPNCPLPIRVTSSSEAFGEGFPKLALFNIFCPVVVTLIFSLLFIPQFHLEASTLDCLSIISFLVWYWVPGIPCYFALVQNFIKPPDDGIKRFEAFQAQQIANVTIQKYSVDSNKILDDLPLTN